jgi:hypothetical protein
MDDAMSRAIGHRAKCRRGGPGPAGPPGPKADPSPAPSIRVVTGRDNVRCADDELLVSLVCGSGATDGPKCATPGTGSHRTLHAQVIAPSDDASGQLSPARHIMTASARTRAPSVKSVAIGVVWQGRQ